VVHHNAGLAEVALGDLPAAARSFGVARALAPHEVKVALNLARVLFDLGRLDDAAQVYVEALRESTDPRLRIGLGAVLIAQEKWPAATQVLRLAVNRAWGRADAHALLGQALLREGDAVGASNHLRAAAETGLMSPAPSLALATAHAVRGLRGLALQELERILREWPDSPEASEAQDGLRRLREDGPMSPGSTVVHDALHTRT
jgi:tetratricopeptide (TPR) repeat protein